MVCFFTRVRRVLPCAAAVIFIFSSCGCNYHGRIKRGIYKTPSFDDKIEARVMVVGDKFLQQTFSFKDDNLTPVNSYTFRVDDGAAVAAADALATLFSEVEVNEYKYRSQYDYLAELDYQVTEESDYYTNLEVDEGFLRLRKYRIPQFHTKILLTLRDPNTRMPLLQLDAEKTTPLEFNNTAVGFYWFNRLTFSLLFPLIAPGYASSVGGSIRNTLEQDLRSCLRKIMKEMEDNRILFKKGISPTLARNDRRYRHLLEKTIYIETPDAHATGFFISPDGYIITNAHAVENYRDVRYYLYEDLPFEPFRAEPPFRYARVIKVNRSRDLALLKAEGKFPYFELDSDRSHYNTGDTVIAIGNPENEYWSVTEGIISALKNFNGTDVIQTDTAINHGNSGGPLVSPATGKVLGVNSRGMNPALATGINYAITSFEVKRTLEIDQPIDDEKLLREEVERRPQSPRKNKEMYQDGQNYVK